jgi:hypothetical protein
MDYKNRQRIYFVPKRGENKYIIVEKVGRKWVSFAELRDDYCVEKYSNVVIAKNYGVVGNLYESEEAYKEKINEQYMREYLARRIEWKNLPIEQIKRIHKIATENL